MSTLRTFTKTQWNSIIYSSVVIDLEKEWKQNLESSHKLEDLNGLSKTGKLGQCVQIKNREVRNLIAKIRVEC